MKRVFSDEGCILCTIEATMKELERLQVVTNEFKFRDYDHAKERCITILKGLGFTDDYISKRTMDLSGGWRMRYVHLVRLM